MLAQAFSIVANLLPAWTTARIGAAVLRGTGDPPRRPDPLVRRLPEVSEEWLADHCRRTGIHGHQP